MPYKDKQKQKECDAKWYQEHKEEKKVRNKKRYQDHKEKIKVKNAKYYQEHREEALEYKIKAHMIRQNTINNLKINGCAICGYNKCLAALEFHHANPKDKKYQIYACTIHKPDFADELQKCILLCANCHREIHEKERNSR